MTQVSANSVWPVTEPLDPQFAARVPDCDVYELDNGLRVVMMRDGKDRSCKFEVYVNAGALHQQADKRGIAHFTEHMLFRGTQELPNNVALMEFSQEYNLDFNGATSHNYQSFYAESDADLESAEAAAKLVSQVVFAPTFPAESVEVEREIVYSEREAKQSDPSDFAYEVFENHFYSQEHPFGGGGVIGEGDTIRKFNREDVTGFFEKYFHPRNMVLIVTGGLSKSTLRKITHKYFGTAAPSDDWQVNPLLGRARDTETKLTEVRKDFNHVDVTTGIYFHKPEELTYPSLELYALRLATTVLSIRMFLDIRERQGLAYSTGAFVNNLYHGYLFEAYGEFPKEKYAQARGEMEGVFTKFVQTPITPDEFRRALRRLKSLRWADNAKAIARHVGYNLYQTGQLLSPEMNHRFFDELTNDYVNTTVQKMLSSRQPEVLAVGPLP